MQPLLLIPDAPGAPDSLPMATELDRALRPERLEDYIGQPHLTAPLRLFLQAARERGEPLEHVLLWGPPGLHLLRMGLIRRSPRGRCLTEKGYRHLGLAREERAAKPA